MSSLLEAANSSADKFILDGSLPKRKGEVSIMSIRKLCRLFYKDPTLGYDTSTYYVYGIADTYGITGSATGSTSANLQAVGLQWYKQLNKPTLSNHTWNQAGHRVFGGPFHNGSNFYTGYGFYWMDSIESRDSSDSANFWDKYVDESVYVAVVCAHE